MFNSVKALLLGQRRVRSGRNSVSQEIIRNALETCVDRISDRLVPIRRTSRRTDKPPDSRIASDRTIDTVRLSVRARRDKCAYIKGISIRTCSKSCTEVYSVNSPSVALSDVSDLHQGCQSHSIVGIVIVLRILSRLRRLCRIVR